MSSLKKLRATDIESDFHALATAMMQFARKHKATVIFLALPEASPVVLSATNATEDARRMIFDSFDTGAPSLIDEMRPVPKTGDA